MLNEKFLNQVSGGKPFIELIGKFIAGFLPIPFGSLGVGGSQYEAHDDMGQSGTVTRMKVEYQPPIFQSFGATGGKESVTIINSDNMRDLQGGKVYFGAKAQLPPIISGMIDKASHTEAGAKHSSAFGVLIPDNAKGTEISFGLPDGKSAKMTVSKSTNTPHPAAKLVGGAGFNLGVTLSAGISVTDAKVTEVDRMANTSYLEFKATMDQLNRNNEMLAQQQAQQQAQQTNPWGGNPWEVKYYY